MYRDRDQHTKPEGTWGVVALLIVLALVAYSVYQLLWGHDISLTGWS
jgi:hypothetical protein